MVAEQDQAAVAASSNQGQSVELAEKMMKMVSITVKQIMGEIVPHLLKPPQESIRTVDGDKRTRLDEKYFGRMDKFTGESNQFRMWSFNFK
eukprot:4296937-Karenia_brevis.AAC.1